MPAIGFAHGHNGRSPQEVAVGTTSVSGVWPLTGRDEELRLINESLSETGQSAGVAIIWAGRSRQEPAGTRRGGRSFNSGCACAVGRWNPECPDNPVGRIRGVGERHRR